MFTKKSTLLILSFFILIMFGCSKPEDKILGVWEITFGSKDSIISGLFPGESLFKYKFEKQQSLPTIITFHRKGKITSAGWLVGYYKFIDKDSLEYKRKAEWVRHYDKSKPEAFVSFDKIYVTIEFLSKDKMVWYKDTEKFKAFKRVKKEEKGKK